MKEVIKAKYLKDYLIRITFDDNVVKDVDFSLLLKNPKNLLLALVDQEYFKNFAINNSTISWPNEVEFCPDVLYKIGKEVKDTKPKKKQSYNLKLQPSYMKKSKGKGKSLS